MSVLRPLQIQPRSFYVGETFRGRLSIRKPDGVVKDLTGSAVMWGLLTADDQLAFPALSLGDGIVFEGGDPTAGVLIITVAQTVTADLLPERHVQEFVITDGDGDVQIYRGDLYVTVASMAIAA